MIRLFVSSRMSDDELAQERAAGIATLREVGAIPIAFEHEPASPKHWRDWWRGWIPCCDGIVVLLDRTLRDAVCDEVLTAETNRVPIFAFVRGSIDVLSDRTLEKDPGVSDQRADEFYACLSAPKIAPFADVDDLVSAVRRAVVEDDSLSSRLFEELERIRETFMPPSQYEECRALLEDHGVVIITGPPHIGKTATAAMVVLEQLNSRRDVRFFRLAEPSDIEKLSQVNRAAVLWDDAFATVEADAERASRVVECLERTARSPHERRVVVTSRLSVLQELATQPGRFSEVCDRLPVVEIDPASAYDEEALATILERHVEWAAAHPSNHGEVGEPQRALVADSRSEVVRRLQFPHNMHVFCTAQLPSVTDEGSLWEAVADAQDIKQCVKQWALAQADAEQLLLLLMSLVDTTDVNRALRLAQLAGCGWVDSFSPESNLSAICGMYFHNQDSYGPGHPSYGEAVVELVKTRPRLGMAAWRIVQQNPADSRADDHRLGFLFGMLLNSDGIDLEDLTEAVSHSLQLGLSRPYRTNLVRDAMRLWRPDLAHLYARTFADAPPLSIWVAGRVLQGIWADLPSDGQCQLATLLLSGNGAGRAEQVRWPEHDRPSAYEVVFQNLSNFGPAVEALLSFQAYSDPDRFASEYARDILQHYRDCPHWWPEIFRHALDYGDYHARERLCFAMAERRDDLPEVLRGCLLAQATSDDARHRLPALRAIWRHHEAVDDDLKQTFEGSLERADPAAIDAILRRADWWHFPERELGIASASVTDGELALLSECQYWARSQYQDFPTDALADLEDRRGDICQGWAWHEKVRHSRTDMLALADDALTDPNPLVRLAGIVNYFGVEAEHEQSVVDRIPMVSEAFGLLPPALQSPAVAEIIGQRPKLQHAVTSFLLTTGSTKVSEFGAAFATGEELAATNRRPKRRFFPAYPTLYLALWARGEQVVYQDCMVARLRNASIGLYGLG